ncbi:hypothetical protein [Cohnella silvisoli]|uniref:YbaB/EbfC family DNA-binding protein n=1 Tax=Cohnella silvisoli TaxID=2873699 RepID=A0ABV1KTW5_9BACL|nr:hypothetical protein [Cohnella silvisoli]MCD9022846.1 hypothetical protein [Cohnella silvisoli]
MEKVHSSEELMGFISNMDHDNSVCQFYVPGKGKFTLVLQEEEQRSVLADVETNPELGKMIEESMKEYKARLGMSTSDLLTSLSPEDFR